MSQVAIKHIQIELPTKLEEPHQKLIDDLQRASAEDFDKIYTKQQVDAHQEAVHLFKKYAAKGEDADVKQYAETTLPTLQEHLDKANKLRQSPAT